MRRIDELGRVVIPKEIRRTQRIRRGDPLEIFTTGDGEVIFKKYSPIGELDPEFSSGAAALGIVLGTAGLGYVTYVCGSSLYLHDGRRLVYLNGVTAVII